jgi:L-alanine-DL-glutamate epimerase-like enolase superfamily enzyme
VIDAPVVSSVEAWLVRLPLVRPVRFATHTWSNWNYVVVRVESASGRTAGAFGFIGELPIDLMVTEVVGPALVGQPAGDLHSLAERCANAAGPPLCDLVRPAASLVEVCLWDIASQEAGLPLWQLLQTSSERRSVVPVMLVEHRREDDSPLSFATRVAALSATGVDTIKLKHYGDAKETRARLSAIRGISGDELELVVDVGWAWTDLSSAIEEALMWEEFRLTWIEDPFPPHHILDAVGLRKAIHSPIGIGDMVTSLELAERLIIEGAVDVLRVDVTTMGGIAGVGRLTATAADAGVEISPELLAEVHQHLAFAWPSVRLVELYTPDSGIWSGDGLMRQAALDFQDPGHIKAPVTPGSGLELDWVMIERHAARQSRHPTHGR